MPSSLFGNNPAPQQPNNMISMIRQFGEFKNSLGNQDPKTIVQGLLQSGRMSQQQFNELSETAKSLSQFLK